VRDIPFEPFVPRRAHRGRARTEETPSIEATVSESPPNPPETEVDSASAFVVEPGPARQHDHDTCFVEMRQRIIALAAEACARALKCAVARNPLFVARFVDEALTKMGSAEEVSAVLHADDASACAQIIACEVKADGSLERGTVIVRAAGSSIGATLEERADLLVRAAEDA
jgi:flagellar assembly protein FliH